MSDSVHKQFFHDYPLYLPAQEAVLLGVVEREDTTNTGSTTHEQPAYYETPRGITGIGDVVYNEEKDAYHYTPELMLEDESGIIAQNAHELRENESNTVLSPIGDALSVAFELYQTSIIDTKPAHVLMLRESGYSHYNTSVILNIPVRDVKKYHRIGLERTSDAEKVCGLMDTLNEA